MKTFEINFLILVVVILLLPTSAFAEDDFSEVDLLSNIEVDDDLMQLNIPSVYSASKYEQKVTKAPASISIVTADFSS